DVLAVFDTTGAQRPILLASTAGDVGALVLQFVHRHPEHCSALILANTTACMTAKPDYPEGLSPDGVKTVIEMFERNYGREEGSPSVAPSRSHDPAFRAWYARAQRMSGVPRGGADSLRPLMELDARALLPSIRVPTLVIGREKYFIPPAQSRYMADHIPGA